MQNQWFDSINNDQNFYFLVCPHIQPIGLISISSLDYEHQKGFAGLFIHDDAFLGTDVPVRSSLCLLDVFFTYTDLGTVYAKVRESNVSADEYNRSLGFERIKKIELGQGYEYGLERENYFIKAKALRDAAMRVYGTKTSISFDNSAIDMNLKSKFIRALNLSGTLISEDGLDKLEVI